MSALYEMALVSSFPNDVIFDTTALTVDPAHLLTTISSTTQHKNEPMPQVSTNAMDSHETRIEPYQYVGLAPPHSRASFGPELQHSEYPIFSSYSWPYAWRCIICTAENGNVFLSTTLRWLEVDEIDHLPFSISPVCHSEGPSFFLFHSTSGHYLSLPTCPISLHIHLNVALLT
ncbi:hypothetical protein A0H81_01730 [Grifola frondosa]|uniref:Uncharacterized protein n=1 Tax=Grifola frondosa TaxID=5627 RepID=A0A1C7MT46_GRIFR|nr:hypothetical protein A0H81_01730 [Grifola frondosa]